MQYFKFKFWKIFPHLPSLTLVLKSLSCSSSSHWSSLIPFICSWFFRLIDSSFWSFLVSYLMDRSLTLIYIYIYIFGKIFWIFFVFIYLFVFVLIFSYTAISGFQLNRLLFLFFYLFWLSINCIFCFFQFDILSSFLDEFAFLLETLLSFQMHFNVSWLDWTHFFDEMYLTFLFLIFLNLIKFPLLMNLHFCSSLSTSMIFHEISFLLCLLINHFSFIFMEIPALFSFHIFFLVEVFSSLMTISFSHSLMLSRNLIALWWIFFLPNLMDWTFTFL